MNLTNAPRQYQAIGFDEAFHNGRASGFIRIHNDFLTFIAENIQIDLPLSRLQIKLGGSSDRLVFFSHPDKTSFSVYTSEQTILQHPALATSDQTTRQLARIHTKKTLNKLIIATVLAVIAFLGYGLYLLKAPAVNYLAGKIPVAWEKQLGDTVFEQAIGGKKLIETDEIKRDLEKLTTPLVKAIDNQGYQFQFHIIDDPTLNAFAIPGGHVVIHSGLILNADRSEEVLGVLAHEIAHVTHRHSLKQMINSAGLMIILQALLGDAEGVMALITQHSAFLLQQKYSRNMEGEADDSGLAYLLKAKINPNGLVTFFEKLQAQSGTMGEIQDSLNLLSTHPKTESRIEALQEKIKHKSKNASFIKIELDFKGFQDKVKKV
jgi:predicted Zn-dependent protease